MAEKASNGSHGNPERKYRYEAICNGKGIGALWRFWVGVSVLNLKRTTIAHNHL